MKTSFLLIVLFLSLFAGGPETKKENSIETGLNELSKPSGLTCTPFNVNGVQRCIAGIDTQILNVTASNTQHADQWCWAACIQAVFSYYGYRVSQQQIVSQTWGTIVNMPAQPHQILGALNRTWTDQYGRTFSVSSNSYSANPMTAAQDLASDQPLIIGTQGHAMVLTALEYDRDQFGNGQVISAIVRDPWPSNPRRRVLSPQEWNGTTFLARIRVY